MSSDKVSELMLEYGISNNSRYGLISIAVEGLLTKSFFDLANISGIKREELAGFLNISLKTVMRYSKENKKLNPLNSEQILKLLALYHKGIEIFGNVEEFNNWLHVPSYGLDNLTPYYLLSTISGIDLIHDELSAIEYGDFS